MKKMMIWICILLACFTTSVCATGSIVVNGAVNGEVLQYGKVVDGSYAVFESMEQTQSVKDVPQTVQQQISQLNAGQSIEKVIDTKQIKSDISLSNYALLTQIQDLKAYDSRENRIDKAVTVSWEVPNLTKSNSCALCILHYSTQRNIWETIKPDKIDLENNCITVTFKDLSPVAVLYDSTSACTATSHKNASTNTGVVSNSNTYIYLASGAILIGVFLVLLHCVTKKKHK